MKVSIIAAVAQNGAIGKNNALLWHLPADMKFFRETTSGHCVITGRKNYESIPEKFRPLPNRTNVVVTRQHHYAAPGAVVVHSLEEALDFCRKQNETEVFIIGGAEIYREALSKNLCDRMYITHVKAEFDADAFFQFDLQEWTPVQSTERMKDEKNAYDLSFVAYNRK